MMEGLCNLFVDAAPDESCKKIPNIAKKPRVRARARSAQL